MVVIDEAHRIRNPNSQQGQVCRQMAAAADVHDLHERDGRTVPTRALLSRAGCSAIATGGAERRAGRLQDADEKLRIGRAKGRWKNWSWEPNEGDRAVMSALLYKGPEAIGLRRRPEDIAGWPEVQRELAPIALDREGAGLYEATWREFRRELGLAGGSTRRPTGWAADLRFRQKASLLRIGGTADFAGDLLDDGQQVAISVAFLETSAMLAEKLRGLGWSVGEINGQMTDDANEATRVAFQTRRARRGDLHGHGVHLASSRRDAGRRARQVAVVHDMRHSAIQLQQIEGRCHRDGQRAVIYYAFAEGTVEEKVAATAIARMAAMDGMAGDDTTFIEEIAALIEDAARLAKEQPLDAPGTGRARTASRTGS